MRFALLCAAAAASITLAGCAGASYVGWGQADEVLFSTADTIKIQWDNLLTNEAAVTAKAQAHCGDRQLQVVDASSDVASFGMVRSRTWRCVAPLK